MGPFTMVQTHLSPGEFHLWIAQSITRVLTDEPDVKNFFIMFVIASKYIALIPGLHKQSDLLIMIIDLLKYNWFGIVSGIQQVI